VNLFTNASTSGFCDARSKGVFPPNFLFCTEGMRMWDISYNKLTYASVLQVMAMMVWIYSICTNASDNVKAGR
jgi:hypothetical protein